MDAATLAPVALLLGMRHGADADHLAAVDALARLNAGTRIARGCGGLFALGHGAVVVVVAVTASRIGGEVAAPAWLNATGAVASIGILCALGAVNLRLAFAPGAAAGVLHPLGRLAVRVARPGSALHVLAIGALFALSFDTVAQALVYAAAARGDGAAAAGLAGLFVLGMLAANAPAGYWAAWLNGRADVRAVLARRVMCGAAGTASLLVAAVGVWRLLQPAAASGQAADVLAVAVVGALVAGFVVAIGVTKGQARPGTACVLQASIVDNNGRNVQ
jgi:high-affinity nickel-transport protein